MAGKPRGAASTSTRKMGETGRLAQVPGTSSQVAKRLSVKEWVRLSGVQWCDLSQEPPKEQS